MKNTDNKRKKPCDVSTVITKRRRELRTAKEFRMLIVKILTIAGLLYLFLEHIFGLAVINGEMMYPMLRDGDVVMFYRLDKKYVIGDIIALDISGKQSFLRVCALGGDTVDISDDGKMVVNGNILQEETFFVTEKEDRETQFPITLAENELFVLGDHRTMAEDSRDFGAIPTEKIKGKVISLLLRRRGI